MYATNLPSIEETCLNSWEEALEQDLMFQESSQAPLENGQEDLPERNSKTTQD
jgi:hypothetical protein